MEHPDMKAIRILVAENWPVWGYGLRRVIDAQPDMEVVAQVQDGAEAVERAIRLCPDVMLVDVDLPTTDGLEATRKVAQELDNTRVIVLTAFDRPGLRLKALEAGASAYFPKDADPATLISAIRTVAEGKYVVGDKVMNKAQVERWCKKEIERLAILPELAEDLFIPLSPREMEILKLIAKGATNKEIAHHLGVSVSTVKRRVSSIYRKLPVRDRSQATVLALRLGWVKLESV